MPPSKIFFSHNKKQIRIRKTTATRRRQEKLTRGIQLTGYTSGNSLLFSIFSGLFGMWLVVGFCFRRDAAGNVMPTDEHLALGRLMDDVPAEVWKSLGRDEDNVWQ